MLTVNELSAWTNAKLPITAVDTELEKQVTADVLSKLVNKFSWTGDGVVWASGIPLVRSILSMTYVGYLYVKTISTDVDTLDSYGQLLLSDAEKLLTGILSGAVVLTKSDNTVVTVPYVELHLLNLELTDSEPKFTMDAVW